ncbi:MAG: WG repeat-containing protein [Flavobacterium sp.]
MKKSFLFTVFLLITFFNFSQQKNEYRPISEMNSDEKEMYDILQKSIMALLNNKPTAKLFPVFKIKDEKKVFVFSSLIYDEPNFETHDEGSSSATYTVSLHFTKRIEPNENEVTEASGNSYGTGNSNGNSSKKIPIEYYLSVEYSKSNNSFQDRTLLSVKKDKPYFDNKFTRVKFWKSNGGNFINPLIYKIDKSDYVSYVDSEIAIYKKDSLFGIINNKNKVVVPFKFKSLRMYKMGILVQEDKTYYFIDKKGKKISTNYDKVEINFNQYFDSVLDCFKVKIGDKYTLVNNNFEEKLPLIYDKITFFHYKNILDRLLLERDGKKVLFDIAKWQETNLVFDKIQVLDDKEMIVEEKGKSGIVDYIGTVILPLEYDSINYLTNYSSDGILLVLTKNNKNALYTNRKFFTEFDYDSMTSFQSSIKVEKNKKHGLMDAKGKIILPIDYDTIEYNKKVKKIEATKNSEISYFDFNELYKK